jgi:endonuclease YncB( thermonuclease family)
MIRLQAYNPPHARNLVRLRGDMLSARRAFPADSPPRRFVALATMTLREMIEGKFIEIRRDGHDKYGRTLAHVSIRGGGNVAELMIRQRLAVRFGDGRPDWCSGLAQRALQR